MIKCIVYLLALILTKVFAHRHNFLCIQRYADLLKGALAKIFVKKILPLEIEERLWFVIKNITLKQTPLTLKKQFPYECIIKRVSNYI